jgi:hypothetical protein
LDGDYEVGLAQLIYPHTWFNFINQDNNVYAYFVEYEDSRRIDYIFPNGQFPTEETMLHVFNDIIGQPTIVFFWNPWQRRVKLVITQDEGRFYMSEGFRKLFGFESQGPYKKGPHYANRTFDMNGGLRMLYVYCDIASFTLVGDTKVPLLRVCDTDGKYGLTVQKTFTHPHYVPLGRREFETIEININNELGQPVAFEFGKAVVTLHFRRKNKLIL